MAGSSPNTETRGTAAAHEGFVTYGELRGPDLDSERWSPARLPLPTGGEHIPLDPSAEVAVGEGEVRVTIPRFTLSHDRFQAVDSAKYLVFSTRDFVLPPHRPATVAVELAVTDFGEEPGDFRRGMAAFAVVEQASRSTTESSRRTEDFDHNFTRLRWCEVTLDRSRSIAAWRVDDHTVYEVHGTVIPERARIGFGIWTMLPIRDGRSRSLDGQGLSARWRQFRVRAGGSVSSPAR